MADRIEELLTEVKALREDLARIVALDCARDQKMQRNFDDWVSGGSLTSVRPLSPEVELKTRPGLLRRVSGWLGLAARRGSIGGRL